MLIFHHLRCPWKEPFNLFKDALLTVVVEVGVADEQYEF